MPSTENSTEHEHERPGTLKLPGCWKRTTFHNGEADPESLPPDLSSINFALMKINQSTSQWYQAAREREQGGVLESEMAAETTQCKFALPRDEVITKTAKFILAQFASNLEGVEQAAMVFPVVMKKEVNLVVSTVAAIDPVKWPATAIAHMTLRCLEHTLLPEGLGEEGEFAQTRLFKHDGELESHLTRLLKTCDSIVGGKVDALLRSFTTTAASTTVTAAQESTSISASDFQTASRLLSFTDPDDMVTMSAIVEALGTFRMPPNAIAAAVENLLKNDGVQFFKKIKEELVQRYTVRSTPSPYSVSSVPTRSNASRVLSQSATPPLVTKVKEEDFEIVNLSNAGSVSAPSSPKKLTSPIPSNSSMVLRLKTAIENQSESPSERHRSAPVAGGSGEGHSATQSVSARTAPPRGVSISDIEFAMRSTVVKCGGSGSDRFSFKWWHANLPQPITSPDEVALAEKPSPGDVFTYFCTARNSQVQVFWFTTLGWVDITTDYIRNSGRLRHPDFPPNDSRILTWKSVSKRSPSYVTEAYFNSRKKNMSQGENLNMADYVKMFSKMSASEAEPEAVSSASQ